MRYKKHFTFYANAPVDRANVDVAATQPVLNVALEGLSVFDMGAESGGSTTAQEWANFNFSPFQKTLFAPMPRSVNVNEINYLRVDFYDGEVTQDNDVPAHSFFYFVDDAKPDDEGESLNDDVLTIFALTLDPWATNVLYGNPRFFGGVLTRAGAITDRLNVSSADRYDAPVELPFNPNEERIEEKDFFPVYETFRAVLQVTGKDLGRAVLLVSESALDAATALKSAQEFTTARSIKKRDDGKNILEDYDEGEFSVQGAYIVPDDLIVYNGLEEGKTWAVYPAGAGSIPEYFYREVITSIQTLTGTWQKRRLSLNNVATAFLKQDAAAVAPFPFPRRVSLGTPFSRFDLTEFLHRGDNLPTLDATIETFFGVNSFNIVLTVGNNPPKDITNDFQIFALTDPENDYIRSNKTNAILSGLGSVGSIAGGIASIASGAGLAAGVGLIAGGATGLTRTIAGFQTAATAPDQLTSAGYGDVTAIFGGVYYEVSTYNVDFWKRKTKAVGIGRSLTIRGAWDIARTGQELDNVVVNPLAVSGATIKGMPAGDAEEISNILQRGVRLWYDAAAWAERSI